MILAKLHYDEDAAEILRRAPLIYSGSRVAVFPDYTPGVAKARATFTDAQKALRRRKGVRPAVPGQLFLARLRISYKDEDKEFFNHQEAMDYIRKSLKTECILARDNSKN